MGAPLAGITVVSLEQAVAAPLATRHLADLGARIIKIERPAGDFARGYDASVHGLASYFVWLNRSKESVVLDLKSDHGTTALAMLLDHADVFVHNLAPGSVERLGFGRESVRERWPRVVACEISGYGRDGPHGDRKAYDLLIQAEVGLVSVTGSPDAPAKVGISVADIAAGMYAFSGILTGLLQRTKSGQGCALEVSLFDSLAEWMGNPSYFAHYSGASPKRTGARHATIAPYGPFVTQDDHMLFVAVQNDREWFRFRTDVIHDEPSLADDRFATNVQRVAHRDALEKIVSRAFEALSLAEAIQRLESANIAFAEARSVRDLFQHPQIQTRKRFTWVDTPNGPIWALVPPVTSDTWTHVSGAVPGLGEHTEAVFAELGIRGSRPDDERR